MGSNDLLFSKRSASVALGWGSRCQGLAYTGTPVEVSLKLLMKRLIRNWILGWLESLKEGLDSKRKIGGKVHTSLTPQP